MKILYDIKFLLLLNICCKLSTSGRPTAALRQNSMIITGKDTVQIYTAELLPA